MIGLKKMYSEELLRLALVLSLLRSDPEQYLRDDLRLIAGVNGSDWAPEITRSQYLHPKSIDSMLMNYERDLFEELQSLGRWGDTGSAREAIQAYLLNGVENNVQQAPVQLSQSAPPDDHQNYTTQLENDDVEQCITIKTEEDNSELLNEVEDNSSGQNSGNVIDSITMSASFIRNLSTFQGPLMEEDSANSVPFDVSQFFANPPPIKKEDAEEGATADDFFDEDDNAIDDFVPYYNLRGDRDSITHQNLADLNDFEETPETLKAFKKRIEKVDEKLDERDIDFEKYLIENTDLDEEQAKLVAIKSEDDSASYNAFIAEDLVNEVCIKTEEDDDEENAFGTDIHPSSSSFLDAFNIKRERASTSFTSAGSSGVGDEAYASSSSSEGPYLRSSQLKIERDEGYSGDELTQEDMDLIEVLWKQDVDMGFSLDAPQALDPTKCILPETFTSIVDSSCPDDAKMRKQEMDEIDKLKESLKMSCESKGVNQDHSGSSMSSPSPDEDDDLWAGLNYTVDTETGEYVLSSELQGDRFSLLEEALQLVDIHETSLEDLKSTPVNEEAAAASSSGLASSSDPLRLGDSDTQKDKDLLLLDEQQEEQGEEGEMLAGRYGPAGPYHHHNHHHQQHLAAAYHHQNLVRSMSMEQRWQDLATLLALPAQQVAQHEQHELYHHHHQHLGHGAQMSPGYVVPPYTPLTDKTGLSSSSDIYGASNLGSAVAASMSVSHHSHHQQTQPQQQQQHVHQPQPQAQPGAGVQQHHPQAQHHPNQQQQGAGGGFYKPEHQEPESCYYQSNTSSELNATSDGFLQSILNDDDLQLMDMAMSEGMYTMRMLESAGGVQGANPIGPQPQGHLGAAMSASATVLGGGGALGNGHLHHHSSASLIPQHLGAGHNGLLGHHNMSMGSERIDASSDSAVSSMGSERVPSLSDSEWCDGGSDSAQDYHGKMRPEDVEARQVPLVAQKKHQMFGKRCFQEQAPSVIRPRPNMEPPSLLQPPPPLSSSLKYEYDHHTSLQTASYPPDHGHITPEMKYSCTMEFNRDVGSVAAARHNHTYSLPPAPPQPPHRPLARDKRGRRGMDMNVGNCSGSGPLTRDEKRARALGIPLSVQDIINLPMDEFNERLSKHDLTETQLSLIRDIRRRGKNKVAAQNCRKRKLDQITSLADEVRDVRTRKMRLQREHQQLLGERQRSKEHFAALYRHVFQHLRDSDGNPLSSQQYSLQQAADGAVVLVPRSSLSSGTLLPTVRSPDSQDRHMSTNGTSEDEMERIKIKRKSYEQ